MKKNAMRKNLRQSILKSFGRYIAIVAIIALGAALFVGLLMTKADMVATGQKFVDEQNMFDLRLMNSYGWTEEYLNEIAALDGVVDAEGVTYLDLIARLGEAEEDGVYRFYSMPETINQVALRGGRMPQAPDECLADGFRADDSILGQKVTISETNEEDSWDSVVYKTYTIVGYVATPLYMDMNRGTTSVGSGTLTSFFYIPEEAFDVDYYSEIHITIPGEHEIYTEAYNDTLEAAADALEPQVEQLAHARFLEVKQEAEEEYSDGLQEYLDGVEEFEESRAEAEQELSDGYQELLDAEEDYESSRRSLISAGQEIADGRKALEEAREELDRSRQEFEAAYAAAIPQMEAAKAQLDENYDALKPGYDAAADGLAQLKDAIAAKEGELEAAKNSETPDEAVISQLEGEISGLVSQLSGQEAAFAQVSAAMEQIEAGYQQLEAQKQQLADAEAQLEAGAREIAESDKALDEADYELAVGWEKLKDGRAELDDGWAEYEEGKLEAEQEIADAEADLAEAKQELDDAREDIDSMTDAETYILDRTSNIGYNNLDSSSDIVQGVSRVFPAFFLLVASLVCITTMTRMIDEERTQIGTLKALGYSNAAIIGKYLIYSGSGAIIGCGLGVVIGSVVFPMILWQAYCIMLYIQPNIVLTMNWPLCIAVVVVYTAVMLAVTWYCCHRTLEEEPAELIRPKAPDAGKKILLEYLPFWHKVSFLNKVTVRNIFRYRQRLAMMLVGIGGCTALLVTGFGLRDSIVNVVDYQFEEVTSYDLEVYFNEGITEEDRQEFLEEVESSAESSMFYHQSSVELEFDDRVKEIYMIAAGDELQEFIDLHSGEEALSMPGMDEVVLSVGVAEAMDIDVGDSVVLRNADMQVLELTVSGIYDNHVYNYSIVRPETIEAQRGTPPEQQMAFVKVLEEETPHAVGARIAELDSVMNVSVSDDLAGMVRNMMEALDLVVIVVVVCAGLLAVIVLYNLTNININERIREIATIKVLGFNASETAAYVFKENLSLTVIGAVLGLGIGKLLLAFVMSQIKIDMVWFKALVEPPSYLWAIALTILSAIVVDFIFYFKLEKINMAEALKSVE